MLQCYIEALRLNLDVHPCSLGAIELEGNLSALLNKYMHLVGEKAKLENDSELRAIRWEKRSIAQQQIDKEFGKLTGTMFELHKEYTNEDNDYGRVTLHKKLKGIIRQRAVLQKELDAFEENFDAHFTEEDKGHMLWDSHHKELDALRTDMKNASDAAVCDRQPEAVEKYISAMRASVALIWRSDGMSTDAFIIAVAQANIVADDSSMGWK